jgi:tetrahydromethanopterin S-methyltransferase subunit G
VIEQQSQKISALTAEAEELRKIKQRLDQLEKASVAYTSK